MSVNERCKPWMVKEVADYYRVDETTVRRWIARGDVQAERVGRTVRVQPPRDVATSTRMA